MAGELAARDAALRAADTQRRQMLADVSHELTHAADDDARVSRDAADAGGGVRRPRRASGISRPSSARPAGSSASCRTCSTWRASKAAAARSSGACSRSSASSPRSSGATSASSPRAASSRARSVDDAADQVMGDPDRLEQVIENLVRQRRAPRARRRHRGAAGRRRAGGAVRLSVADQGSGIAARAPAARLRSVLQGGRRRAPPATAAAGWACRSSRRSSNDTAAPSASPACPAGPSLPSTCRVAQTFRSALDQRSPVLAASASTSRYVARWSALHNSSS